MDIRTCLSIYFFIIFCYFIVASLFFHKYRQLGIDRKDMNEVRKNWFKIIRSMTAAHDNFSTS